MNSDHVSSATFQTLGIAPVILDILAKKNLRTPTPIQQQSIAPGIEGKDIVGIAQTGTGKTFAFGIPMLQRLAQGNGQGLVIVPTRELAYQVEKSLQTFTPALNMRTAVIIGGVSIETQKNMIRRNPHVIIATPGRLQDHINQRTISLQHVNILVLDEADRMFDMGFRPQIEKILMSVPKDRQTLLFSATMPMEIMRLVNNHMKIPLRIEVAPQGTAAEAIQQELFVVQKSEKLALLETVLKKYNGSILVFSRTKHGAKKITRSVQDMGHTAAEIHANRSLGQRKEALEGFKIGKYRILVATDIAARGIDVAGIEVVINYDLPDDPSDYVHRIGRTARAGMEGRAISFATADQRGLIQKIERLVRSVLDRKAVPDLPKSSYAQQESSSDDSRGGRGEQRRYQPRSSSRGKPSRNRQSSRRYG